MRSGSRQSYQERILRVLIYIQEHLGDAISLDELAAVACFSPFHFHRIFRGMVGESVMEHIRRLRLERAAHQLRSGGDPVTSIAFAAGYETHEAFTRAFHALFGMSPSRFRQLRRPLSQCRAPSGVHYAGDGRLTRFQPFLSGDSPVDVRIEFIPVMTVAFMRHVGPYQDVGATWGKLMSWAGPRGLLGGSSRILGLPLDDPEVTPPEKVRYDACIVVDPGFRPEGEVGLQEVGGGEYAVLTHRGPYRTVGETFALLCGQWLPASGREARSAPPLLIARNDGTGTRPENPAVDVCIPLAERLLPAPPGRRSGSKRPPGPGQ
jgi:AraC family transcriptional regulator